MIRINRLPAIIMIFLVLASSCASSKKGSNPDSLPFEVESEKPAIIHAGWVDKGILGITIKAGNLVRSEFMAYEPQEGDSIVYTNTGRGVVNRRILYRNSVAIGLIAGIDHSHLSLYERITGDTLDQQLLGLNETYSIKIPKSAGIINPTEVYRKSKILTKSNTTNQIAMLHTVYLKVSETVSNASVFRINFEGINLEPGSLTFYNNPEKTRSESLHVTHTGFRPDDPVKRGYLSLWLGTGGAHTFDPAPEFQILDIKTGKVAYEGIASKALAHDGVEILKEEKNYSKTEVWHLDFSAFETKGEYTLYIKGVGTSYPFSIREDVWQDNFSTTMLGFLTHRSGMEITEGMEVNFIRPRSFHPEDGVKVFESTFSLMDLWVDYQGSQDGAFIGLQKNKTNVLRTDAWGGYMDAGDWDRRIQHLNSSRQLLELYLLFPDYFSNIKLVLPADEQNNGIPDILDEVAWNVDCYRRMQAPDGGISMGIESAEHPVEGEPSWLESLEIFRFSEDPNSSFIYAGVAAILSRAIEKYDSERAAVYANSAVKAFDYGLRFAKHPRYKELSQGRISTLRNETALASIELYKLTGEESFYIDFIKHTRLFEEKPEYRNPSFAELDAAFSLATLQADPVVRNDDIRIAAEFIVQHARRMTKMLHGNAYNIVNRIPDVQIINGYYSAANNQEICRAYFLTGEQKYLDAAILSVMYTSGANPMNMTMTSGLGHNFPHRPLHLDSEFTGQGAPHGITVYAQADHEFDQKTLSDQQLQGAWGSWATYWFSGKLNTPSGWDWPPHEAYIDYSRFPGMNEYTVHQTFGPIAYAYGFLAARK